MMVCLDASFLVDLIRGNEEVIYLKEQIDKGSEPAIIASPSIIELIKGLRIGNPKENGEEKIHRLISSLIILDLNKQSAILSGEIEASLIKRGEMIDLEDIMIAAIAITNNEKLITRNEKHFRRINGLEVRGY